MEQARALFPAIGEEDGATRAVAELERLVEKAWSAEGTTMLRHYLGYALATRAVEVRRMLGPGGVVIVEGIADRILALDTCDSELDDFAVALKRRNRAREPRTGQRAVPAFAALLLVFGVVPLVAGGLLGSGPLVSVGVLLSVVLLCAFAWLLRTTGAHRGVRRPAHLSTGR
ncbi:hypothetical protein [Umezawaea sp.]|uniref:hypothetical protein n=1 Tax=Umezawaea sp. TaxID=1955258 RepID=UPI002ED12AEA